MKHQYSTVYVIPKFRSEILKKNHILLTRTIHMFAKSDTFTRFGLEINIED